MNINTIDKWRSISLGEMYVLSDRKTFQGDSSLPSPSSGHREDFEQTPSPKAKSKRQSVFGAQSAAANVDTARAAKRLSAAKMAQIKVDTTQQITSIPKFRPDISPNSKM